MNAQQRYYWRNREHIIARQIRWNKANPEKCKLYGRTWYANHWRQSNINCAIYRKKHPERVKSANRAWYARLTKKEHAEYIKRLALISKEKRKVPLFREYSNALSNTYYTYGKTRVGDKARTALKNKYRKKLAKKGIVIR